MAELKKRKGGDKEEEDKDSAPEGEDKKKKAPPPVSCAQMLAPRRWPPVLTFGANLVSAEGQRTSGVAAADPVPVLLRRGWRMLRGRWHCREPV